MEYIIHYTKKIEEITRRPFDMQEKNRIPIQCDIQKHEIAQLKILMENQNIHVKT